jgi:hypothetical protein
VLVAAIVLNLTPLLIRTPIVFSVFFERDKGELRIHMLPIDSSLSLVQPPEKIAEPVIQKQRPDEYQIENILCKI